MLFAIPARLVIRPLGASGTPATIIGLGFFVWWAWPGMVPSLGVARGFSPAPSRSRRSGGVDPGLLCVVGPPSVAARQRTGADLGALSILSLVGVALVAIDMLGSQASVETLLRRMVIAAAGLAALGVLQFVTGFDISELVKIPGLPANHALHFIGERSNFRRVAGTTSHPIEMGVLLALGLPLALHFAAYTRVHRRRWQVCVLLIGLAIPMTLSRSAILGTVAAFVLLFFTWPGKRRAFTIAVAPVFIVVMRIAIPGLVGTSAACSSPSQDDSIRVGPTTYAVAKSPHQPVALARSGLRHLHPHGLRRPGRRHDVRQPVPGHGGGVRLRRLGGAALILRHLVLRRSRRPAPCPR